MKSKSKIVVETSTTILDIVQAYLDNAGYDHYLSKEDDYDDLVSSVERIVERGYDQISTRKA